MNVGYSLVYTEHLLVQYWDTESIQEMYAELHWNSSQETKRKKTANC